MDVQNIIEAIIFVSDSPLKPEQVVEIFQNEEFAQFEMDEAVATSALEALVEKFKADEHVFELKKIDKGYQFYTKRAYYSYLHHAALLKNQKKLSRAALETLSIIAYRQPVTKTEMEFVRGVNCDYAVQKLLEKKLVEIAGRSESPGRPLLYRTSSYFMEYFGINDVSELPKLQEFSVDEEEYKAQFKVFIEENDELTDIVNEGKKGKEEEQEVLDEQEMKENQEGQYEAEQVDPSEPEEKEGEEAGQEEEQVDEAEQEAEQEEVDEAEPKEQEGEEAEQEAVEDKEDEQE